MKNTHLPPGFAELRFRTHVWWIKTGWEQFFPSVFSSFPTPAATASIFTPTGGRSFLQRLPLPNGASAIVRSYHRGGLIRHFTHDLYWERPFRPLTELLCTETVRQHRVPTVEVLAAGVERIALGFYRGLFISREAEGYVNLWEWLRSNPPPEERRTGIATVARVVEQLHTVGIYHADLNLTNILVAMRGPHPQALIIDFDRARVMPNSLPSHLRKRNLQRLHRSLQKLDPRAQYFSPVDLENFCCTYQTSRVPGSE